MQESLRRPALILACLLMLVGCQREIAKDTERSGKAEVPLVAASEENRQDIDLLRAMSTAGALTPVEMSSPDPSKVELGRLLFFDKVLSGNKDLSCATCHHPQRATSDHLSLSIGTGGIGFGEQRILGEAQAYSPRNAPSLYNLAGRHSMFWDGRIEKKDDIFLTPAGEELPSGLDSALAAQIMLTAVSRTEMRGLTGDTTIEGQFNEVAVLADEEFTAQWKGLMDRLMTLPEYAALFRQAYPELPVEKLGFHHAANAIAAFIEAEFRSLNAPFDRYVAGDDGALTEQQKRGGLLFYGRARCSGCHRGPHLTDQRFHNVAAPQLGPGIPPHQPLDLGRASVTDNPKDRFLFRTPSLRNVELTGPWTHAGAYTTLRGVVEHYRNPSQALRDYDSSQLRSDIQLQVRVWEQLAAGALETLSPVAGAPLSLSDEEVEEILAFLAALTDREAGDRAADIPQRVPSGLPVE